MVKCDSCGKAMERVPDWMESVQVEFVCNNCPNRQTKNIAFVSMDLDAQAAKLAAEHQDVEELPAVEAES